MLDKYTCLEKLAARRNEEVVISSMSVAMPWESLSDGPFDLAHVDTAMGHVADGHRRRPWDMGGADGHGTRAAPTATGHRLAGHRPRARTRAHLRARARKRM